ncbi:SDR family NAD(P)-dependent oxidoreductase [Plantibacter sp. Mn2098]|uniref:SDR family NAD(P)-dependent oxidoreductase n=1 Tax=Plantibacter sp. Mn2098 TaxID=3395266 RepID=UPI003BDA0A02
MKLQNGTRRTVLVAGGSTGIGRAVARRLVAAGHTVVITGRRRELLDEVVAESSGGGGAGRCVAYDGDAADAEGTAALVARVVAEVGPIDVALLNIGAGPVANLRRASAVEITDAMQLNYSTTVNFLVPLIAHLRGRGSSAGREHAVIVHTNSLAGFLAMPMQGPYSAAKAAARVLIDTARIELRGSGIRFLSVYPGFIATKRRADDGVPAPFEISEDRAAAHIIRAIESRSSDVLFPWQTAALVRTLRALPKPVAGGILRRIAPTDY